MPQIIKIKRGNGAPVSLQNSELAYDKLNKNLFIGTETGVLAIGGEGTFATKSYTDSAVSAEETRALAAEGALSTSLNNEISRAQDAESDIAADLAQEVLDRAAAVSAEAALRVSGDSALDGKITVEKGRIDSILALSEQDKDSFKELVDLVTSIDTTNDQAFAGYVLSNNAALAQEVSDRQSGDSALGLRIDGVETSATALTSRVSAAEQDIVDLGTDLAAETTARQTAISGEQTARTNAINTLTSRVADEESARATADTSLSNRLDALEGASADSRLTAVEADVADHETRISALESTIDGGVY
jgi:hypothetical protein